MKVRRLLVVLALLIAVLVPTVSQAALGCSRCRFTVDTAECYGNFGTIADCSVYTQCWCFPDSCYCEYGCQGGQCYYV